MLSYQVFVSGTWYHCNDRAFFYNYGGTRRIVSLTPACFQELVAAGELVEKV